MTTALIADIQKFAIHDGPGIRTTVFFKGCPLNCRWCANPETISAKPEIMFAPDKCMHCGLCLAACPYGAISPGEYPVRDNKLCRACGDCVAACPRNALILRGREMSAEEIWVEVKKDLPFFKRSGGGITLSGGEPFRQPEAVRRVLEIASGAGVHTAVDTCGCVDWAAIEPALPYIDLFLYDIKQADPEVHRQGTGASNELILANLGRIIAAGKQVLARLPLIPGFNDSPADLERIGGLARGLGVREIRILPFHTYGRGKYDKLGINYRLGDLKAMTEAEAEPARNILEKFIPGAAIGG